MKRQRMALGAAITAAVIVGGIGGAVLGVPGVSGAQQGPTSTTVRQNNPNNNAPKERHAFPAFDAAAKALNLTPEQLREKLSDHKTTIADVAKQQNVDIDTVIDAMTQADRDRIEAMVNKPWPERDRGRGGPGGGKHGGFGFGILGRFGAAFDDLAGALNTTPDQLKEDLKDGKTIKEIAEANNVDVNTVINKVVDAVNKKVDEAVSNGKLTKEQGDKIKAEVKEHVTEFVNNGMPKMPGGFGPWGKRGNTP